MEFRPVVVELFHVGGQTDMMKLIDAFRNFTKEPKNILSIILSEMIRSRSLVKLLC